MRGCTTNFPSCQLNYSPGLFIWCDFGALWLKKTLATKTQKHKIPLRGKFVVHPNEVTYFINDLFSLYQSTFRETIIINASAVNKPILPRRSA